MCTLSPLFELGSELWGHGGVNELACVPYIHVAHDGLARAHLPSESHQRPSEESEKGNQGSSGVIGGHRGSSGVITGQAIRRTNRPSSGLIKAHQGSSGLIRAHHGSSWLIRVHQGSSGLIRAHHGSSGFIRVHQAIRRTNRPSAVRIPTARPDDASNSTRDTCVLSFSWQPACFVSPRTRALTMAAVPVGRARRRGEHVYSAARFVHDDAHDDAIEAHSAWIPKEIRGDQRRSGEITGDQGRPAHLRVGSQVGRLDGRSHSACKPSRSWVRPPPSPPAERSRSMGRSGAIRGDQGPSEAIRVHSVVIRGHQTCSRKQIMP